MRFGQGSQNRCEAWFKAILFLGVAVILPGAVCSIAQDDSDIGSQNATDSQRYQTISETNLAKYGYYKVSLSAEKALAKLEAGGFSVGEARQHLQGRMPAANATAVVEVVPFVNLVNDQIYVLGSRLFINAIREQLEIIEQFGSTQLLYTVRIVEVPAEKAEPLRKGWRTCGSVEEMVEPQSGVQLATFKSSSRSTHKFWQSDKLSEQQVGEIVRMGTLLYAPEIVAYQGQSAIVKFGTETPFLTSYEPVKDESNKNAVKMQPVVTVFHDGVSLDLHGVMDAKRQKIRLNLTYEQSTVKGGGTFTFESQHGPLTVQQPDVSYSAIQTSCDTPINNTLALCGETITREVIVERSVPLISKIPYASKLFENTAMSTEAVSTIIFIRCEEFSGGDIPRQ